MLLKLRTTPQQNDYQQLQSFKFNKFQHFIVHQIGFIYKDHNMLYSNLKLQIHIHVRSECLKSKLVCISDSTVVSHFQTVPIYDTVWKPNESKICVFFELVKTIVQ